jgi:hypothetical protein
MTDVFIGVDIQTARRCPYCVIDADGEVVQSGWLQSVPPQNCISELKDVLSRYGNEAVAVGLDAPRCPLPTAREWYWRGGKWVRKQPEDVGNGRHCEVVIAAHRLANPQWTPWRGPFPEWMSLGFELFQALGNDVTLHEVFPSASYSITRDDASIRTNIRLGDFAPHPKDMLDAVVAAVTVREFVQGRGCEVGGGDGFGTIVLPRPVRDPIAEVMKWPSVEAAIGAVP